MAATPTLKDAVALHQQGKIAEAEAAYELILGAQPDHPAVLSLLGLIALNSNRMARAAELLAKAVARNPADVAARRNLIVALRGLNQDGAALAACEDLLARTPDHAEALGWRADLLLAAARHEEAVAAYERVIATDPQNVAAFINLAVTMARLKRHTESVTASTRAIALDPANASAYCNRAGELCELARYEEALADTRQALRLDPDLVEAAVNAGVAAHGLRRYAAALEAFDTALALRPDDGAVWRYRGAALMYLRRLPEAEACFDRALALKPENAQIIYDRALCRLTQGKFRDGWEDHEWRKRLAKPFGRLATAQPELTPGTPLKDKALLIHAEQGLGDTLQFARYARTAAQAGARVTISVPPALEALMRGLGADIGVTSRPLSVACDYHCPTLSLPRIFGIVGADKPYLRAEPARIARWKQAIGDHGFRIGVCWHVKMENENGRSFPLAMMRGIARQPGVRLIGLQKYDGLDQIAASSVTLRLEDLGPDFDPGPDAFLDTAAVMENLDLIISCDTAVAHLGGALCRPTWIALPHAADWRWGESGSSTPWYGSVRLFRQSVPDDWDAVFDAMARALDEVL